MFEAMLYVCEYFIITILLYQNVAVSQNCLKMSTYLSARLTTRSWGLPCTAVHTYMYMYQAVHTYMYMYQKICVLGTNMFPRHQNVVVVIYLTQKSRLLVLQNMFRNSDIAELVDNTNQSSIPGALFHIKVEICTWFQTFNSKYPPQHFLISTVHTIHQYSVCQSEKQSKPGRP